MCQHNYINQITPDLITSLKPNEIFVFGSNLAGKHGKGAARTACHNFGAIYGQGFGEQGQSYAIPTKDFWFNVLKLDIIQIYVNVFIEYAKQNQDKIFFVTEIGCGLAGYQPKDIAPLFKEVVGNVDNINNIELKNVYLPQKFWNVLKN